MSMPAAISVVPAYFTLCVPAVAYNLVMKPSPIAASLKFRHSSNSAQEAAEAMPGPADYTACNKDLCGCKTVRGYTMGQRST